MAYHFVHLSAASVVAHRGLRNTQYAIRRLGLILTLLVMTACGGQVVSRVTPTAGSVAVRLPTPTAFATVAASMRTPDPTRTPAPTPTPVIYVIQPGDTLLGVALQYNITLDQLQQANGVLKPETLQIGQELVIPVGGVVSAAPDTESGVLLPTPTPVAVEVQNAALYQTPVGSLWVVGEVFNPGAEPLENVQVRASLLNAAGVEVAADSKFVALGAVPPQGRSPFGVLFDNPPVGAVAFQVIAIRAEPSRNAAARYPQLQVADPKAQPDGATYHLTGSIANKGSANAVEINVVATLYDQQQRVLAFRQVVIGDGQLAAGATAPFDVSIAFDPTTSSVSNYAIVAQGRVGQ